MPMNSEQLKIAWRCHCMQETCDCITSQPSYTEGSCG